MPKGIDFNVKEIILKKKISWPETEIILLCSKPPDSTDRNSHFTLHNPGVAGVWLPRSVSLFVLQCDFSVLKGEFESRQILC